MDNMPPVEQDFWAGYHDKLQTIADGFREDAR